MILPDTERQSAHARPTHAVDILAFVEAQEIPFDYFERPYYLQPAPGGERAYALLRETLQQSGKIGIAYVVIQARQHLAALVPEGQSLVLNTLRWSSESGSRPHFGVPEEDLLEAQELAMMAAPVSDGIDVSGGHDDRYLPDDVMALADQSPRFRNAPEIMVEQLDDCFDDADDDMVDLCMSQILRRSLHPRAAGFRRDSAAHRLQGSRRRSAWRR
ncbi:Ku protein [Noviherbaspirillum malthae]|uniref:Ku protein n=1 Tax=Noviherbaspirillum malthae TaxID=1260987 RepID=UPI00188DCB50|nr:Ku protein [Noviherbaspirillum malthae]